MIKNERNFGTGSFIGDVMKPEADFFELSVEDQARYLGWVAACPVVEELIDPANPEPGRGPDAMAERYAQVSFWHTFIVDKAAHENAALGIKLRFSEERRGNELVGKYEAESVPQDYHEEYSPMGKLVGFALPRIFIAHLNSSKDSVSRLFEGEAIIQRAAAKSNGSSEAFLAEAAEQFARAGTEPKAIIKSIAGNGWLEEHNGRTMFNKAMLALRDKAPTVWGAYEALSEDERQALDVAEFDSLAVEYEPTPEDLKTIYEGITQKVKQKGVEASDELSAQTIDLIFTDVDAVRITGDELVDEIKISLKLPKTSGYGSVEEMSIRLEYVGAKNASGVYAVLSFLMDKSQTYTKGISYGLGKIPLSVNVQHKPELPDDAEQETQHDTSSLKDIDAEFGDELDAISPDDIALLYRIANNI